MVWHAYVCVVYWNLNHKISALVGEGFKKQLLNSCPKSRFVLENGFSLIKIPS